MPSAHDVAKYIIGKSGQISAMKLQKLVYYAQAWSLVWDEEPLFPQKVRAWVNGPVVRELYDVHKGEFNLPHWPQGDGRRLSADQRKTVDAVLRF